MSLDLKMLCGEIGSMTLWRIFLQVDLTSLLPFKMCVAYYLESIFEPMKNFLAMIGIFVDVVFREPKIQL